MSYQQIKWLILIIPTIVIGLWEYIRHEFLLPYISMELGNWLSPVIVFIVTITFLRGLFLKYERMQEQLKMEREEKAILHERERIARELHDGIAQSLFLCSVQVNHLKEKRPDPDWAELDKSLRQIHDYVRHSICNLKNPPSVETSRWGRQMENWIEQFQLDTGITVQFDLQMEESYLTPKEKVELSACIQEALTNIRKHAEATNVIIRLQPLKTGWRLEVTDNGKGYTGDPFSHPDRFGLRIMLERVREIAATLSLKRTGEQTRLVIEKENQR